jgi:flagellin-like hook-associated protein FlgL
MTLRPTQSSIYSLVERGLSYNFMKLAKAQEHVATGKQILRPSDDAVGTGRALSMRRRLGLLDRFQNAINNGRPVLETSTAALEETSGILSEARALLIGSMSGAMNADDRKANGLQIELALEKLVDVANTKIGDRYVFAGTRTDHEPYELTYTGDEASITYAGNEGIQRISIGFGTDLSINVAGSEAFGGTSVKSVDLTGLTGATLGTTANQGTGYSNLEFRHDATLGTPGSGLALVSGGALDTILADHTLTVDAVANTVQLDAGPAVAIPLPTDPNYADFTVTDENGAQVHLDFTGYNGTSSSAVLTGEGSVSLDGSSFTPLTFTETDLELMGGDSDAVLHINTTDVRRAGKELVSFTGATDIFSVLAGVASDLRNSDELSATDVVARLSLRLDELDSNSNQSLKALGTLGARTERLNSSGARLETLGLNVEGLLSQIEDVDIAEVILDMNRAEQTLQLAQMTGSRLIQHTLLDFLR